MTGPQPGYKGFTLIEILITLVITSIVMMSIFSAFNTQSKSFNSQQQVTEMQQNARAAMDMMTREIRMAKYSSLSPQGIIFDNLTSIRFAYRNDSVAYHRYSGGKLGRVFNGGPSEAVAENIQALSFWYQDAAGNSTATLADIRRIIFSITARTAVPDPMYSLNGGYRTYQLSTTVVSRNP